MAKKIFQCSSCGSTVARASVSCPKCGAFGTIEEAQDTSRIEQAGFKTKTSVKPTSASKKLSSLIGKDVKRVATGIDELDRVLGGGIVEGEVILFSGSPGAGKSTLCLTIADKLANLGLTTLYSSGEESESQIALRAQRMGISSDSISVINETNLETLIGHIEQDNPDFVIVDSLQTIASAEIQGSIGSIQQSKEAAHVLTRFAKKHNIRMLFVSQVTKSDEFAGSNQISHIVDATLMLESDKDSPFRFLRVLKNRFGSTNEVGIFQHENEGLVSVSDFDSFMTQDDETKFNGACKTFLTDGIRQIPCEIQSLVVDSSLVNPRKQFNGIDYSRGQIVCAVVSQHCKARVYDKDVFVSTVAGLRVADPQCDLGVAASILSSYYAVPIPSDVFFVGEVNLTGLIRGNFTLTDKLKDASRIGFRKAVIPKGCQKFLKGFDSSLEIVEVGDVSKLSKRFFEGL